MLKQPKQIRIELEAADAEIAGVRVISARYVNGRRKQRITDEKDARAGGSPDGAARLRNAAAALRALTELREAAAEAGRNPDAEVTPIEQALILWPADLVLSECIRALDGEEHDRPAIEEWVDDLPPRIADAAAGIILGESGLVEETEQAAGEGSGG